MSPEPLDGIERRCAVAMGANNLLAKAKRDGPGELEDVVERVPAKNLSGLTNAFGLLSCPASIDLRLTQTANSLRLG